MNLAHNVFAGSIITILPESLRHRMASLKNAPGPVRIDRQGMYRCLLNLVANAIDACTDFSCTTNSADVVIRSKKTEGWAVEYQVIDSGCGMDDEIKGKVFQRFFSTKNIPANRVFGE